MKTAMRLMLIVALLAGGILAYYFLGRQAPPARPAEQAPTGAPEASPPQPITPMQPPVQFPIEQILPEQLQDAPLAETAPADADALAGKVLADAVPGGLLGELMVVQDVVRRIVVTVDNLPREKVARKLSPVRAASGPFLVNADGGERRIGSDNTARYLPYVKLAESANLSMLVAGYVKLYPLFQQAYRELGYPSGYFNDRLVAVIDHMLAAPQPAGPVAVIQPKVLYQFADPQLEALSAGQKVMIRMGPDNARRIKSRLAVLRAQLAGKALE